MHPAPVGTLSVPRRRSARGRRHCAWLAAGLTLAACLLPVPATAASYTWWATGSSGTQGGSGTWNTANAYWTTNGSAWVPWDNTTNAADTAVFGGTRGTVTLGTAITANRLTFATNGYTVAGQTITLASGTPTITVSSGTAMISSILAGTAGMRKLGAGTLSLFAANTYTGTTTIDNGKLWIGAGGTTGSLGTGIVRLTGSGNIGFNRSDAFTFTNPIFSLTANGIGGFIDHSGAGSLDLNEARVNGITTGNGAGALTITGTLQGWSRTSGPFPPYVNPFVFRPAAGTTIAVTGAFVTDLSVPRIKLETFAISGTAGTVFLGGATQFFNGAFTKHIAAGALDIVGGTSGALLAGNVLFWAQPGSDGNGGVLQLSGTLTSSIGSGTGQIWWENYSMVTLGGFAARTAPAVINIGGSRQQLTSGATGFVSSVGELIFGSDTADNVVTFENPIDMANNSFRVRVVDNPNSTTDSAILSGVLSNGRLDKYGAGLLTLTGNNTNPETWIRDGTLRVGAGGTTGSIGGTITNDATLTFDRSDDLTFSGSISGTGKLIQQGAGTLTLTSPNTFSGTTTVSAGTLSMSGSGSVAGNIVNNATVIFTRSISLIYSGTISGTGALIKQGTPWLTLNGSNSLTGPTTVAGGVVNLGNANGLAGSGLVTFTGGTLRFQHTNTVEYGSRIKNSTSAVVLDTNAQLITITEAIDSTNVAGLTKSGAGTLTLTANNTYTGTTTVSGGTLAIGGGGTTGSVTGNIVNNAAVAFNRSNVLTYGGVISGSGAVFKQGGGNLVLTGTSSYTGVTSVAAGRLSVNGALGNSPVSVLAAAEVGGSGAIGGPVSVANGGTLSPGNSIASLSTGSATFAAGGVFEYEVDSSNLAALDTAADLLVVNGDLNLDPGNGTVIVFSDLAGSPNPFVNFTTRFALVNYSGTWSGGLFTYDGSTLADGGRFFVGGQEWEIDYDRSSSAGLDNFTADYLPSGKFVTVMAVPEPSTIAMALVGLACGGLSMWRRRTRS